MNVHTEIPSSRIVEKYPSWQRGNFQLRNHSTRINDGAAA
jgi:hypothetical protein